MSNQRDYNQVEMVRLKLYIPLEKYHQWMHYLKQNHPNSQFFTNFSNWVRTALIKLPSPGVSPLFPKSIENLSNDHSARKMLELYQEMIERKNGKNQRGKTFKFI